VTPHSEPQFAVRADELIAPDLPAEAAPRAEQTARAYETQRKAADPNYQSPWQQQQQ